MSVISGLQSIASFARVRSVREASPGPQPPAQAPADNRADLIQARRQLLALFDALDKVAQSLDVQTRFKLDLPDAVSNPGLALDQTETPAFLASDGEINASLNSFSPFGPGWTGSSTALLSIGGEYDGSNGTGALTFDVRRQGTKGEDNLRIRVRDPQGRRIINVNIRRNDAPDREYGLGNGLFLTLGQGDLVRNDVTSINVYQGVGSAVDPDKPLAGVRNDSPNFQYYPSPGTLAPIVDGSFDVNGETISVGTTDTINTVIARINASNANVDAVFNTQTERIEFTQRTNGSAPTVEIGNDTSNFTLSTKLATAVVAPGVDRESVQPFADVAAFSSVQSGSLLINGTPIAIDASTDSLESVIDKVNGSAADVTATFDAATQVVTIEANDSESAFEIDSNGTGFFAALNIKEGRLDPEAVGRGISKRRSYRIADAVEALAAELNAVFDNRTFADKGATVRGARDRISSVVSAVLNEESPLGDNLFGVRFDRSDTALSRGRLAQVDRRAFSNNLQISGASVKDVFLGSQADGGLIGRLFLATQTALQEINSTLGVSGNRIDTFA